MLNNLIDLFNFLNIIGLIFKDIFLKYRKMDNKTHLKCDEQTINAVKEYVKIHMNYKISPSSSKEDISKIQDKIRPHIIPFLKKRLPYLKYIVFKNPEFYAFFMLVIVLDKIQIYDWKHINKLLYFNYNPENPNSINSYGFVMKDNYYDSGYEDSVTCCCQKKGCSARNTSKISNDKYTFIVGSKCIEKTCIKYYKDKTSNDRRNDKNFKDRTALINSGVLLCGLCNNEVNEIWKKLCIKCYVKQNDYKICTRRECNNVIKNNIYKVCYTCKFPN